MTTSRAGTRSEIQHLEQVVADIKAAGDGSNPSPTSNVTLVSTNSRTYAILNGLIPDTEESRVDIIESAGDVTDIYKGVAFDGTATSAASWGVVRVYFTNNKPARIRLRKAITWDGRTTGWT